MNNQSKRIRKSTLAHDSDTATTDAVVPHAGTSGPSAGPVPLSCVICGATTSRRGRLFITQQDVVKHQTHMHPEAKPSAPAKTRKPDAKARPGKVRATGETAHAKFCPQCGFNLSVISAALTFVANQETI